MLSLPNRSALVVGLVALVLGCRKPNQFVAPPPPTVTVAHPVERAVADTVEFVGTTQPTQIVDLRARVNGYLEKILFEDGADVQAGQKLFQIDPAPYQSVLDAAKASEQRAHASLSLAQSQYRRMEPLLANNVVTQEELDVQAAQVETTKADVAAAEAAVRKAELDIGFTKITAPISGRIGRHMVDVGNLVQAEQTQLAVIQAIDPIYVYFDVSENELLRFMAMLRKNELPDPDKTPPVLHLGLANEEGFPHEGHLDFREINVNTETGTALRRGIFPNPGWQLIPGMFVRIQAAVGSPKPRVLVDERAIGSDQRGDYLLVVNDKNVVEYRAIKPGIRIGNLRVVESGVTAKDLIVVNGLQRARPGSTVKPEMASATPDDGSTPAVATAAGKQDETATKPSDDAAGKANAESKASSVPAASEAAAPAKEAQPKLPPPANAPRESTPPTPPAQPAKSN